MQENEILEAALKLPESERHYSRYPALGDFAS